ncbi:hypothetical protein MWU65_03675 [Cellulophaga sp. F20128]|uniref:hypothetical protein n=1 Tax=Cellulophaga sp. F20128 TaxID=2926413 RepID=UPI001FF3228C|nr:hypothetical protein [Cellulophaga sp. F20128]MCK0156263.1 hypothetical protein [Cellulophaga sp. F20128]
MKKITILALVAITQVTIQCNTAPSSDFLITTTSFGKLTKEHTANDLKTIFANDSLVTGNDLQFNARQQKQYIYEKGGKPLFSVSISKDTLINNIQVLDPRYTTASGIGLGSTFKDIKDNYTIGKVITSMNNVVLFIKDSGIYFTIDKKELPANLRYDITAKIEAIQIPDAAKIKYMMIDWD